MKQMQVCADHEVLLRNHLDAISNATIFHRVHVGAGMGNQMNIVVHGLLRALLDKRPLRIAPSERGDVLDIMEPSPFWTRDREWSSH